MSGMVYKGISIAYNIVIEQGCLFKNFTLQLKKNVGVMLNKLCEL